MSHSDFRVTLPGFEGTLDDLQATVARGTLPVLDVSLAAITQTFHERVETSETVDLNEVGVFLQAAAALSLSKSRALLPGSEGEEDAADESRRREVEVEPLDVRSSSLWLHERQGVQLFGGESRISDFPRLTEPRSVSVLARAWEDVRKRSADASTHVAAPAYVRLEVALSGLIRRLRSTRRVSLRRLLRGATRQEAVIHFLAVLELVRRRQASAIQEGLFDDIKVEAVAEDVDSGERAG